MSLLESLNWQQIRKIGSGFSGKPTASVGDSYGGTVTFTASPSIAFHLNHHTLVARFVA